ncbi:hypothetical protein QJQ45_028494 [Haematococcus lacustris]|nr:hypothetical protein QJQ45_028494 [Haematococcus lacustris]
MSLVAQCLRGSGPVPRSKSRFRLKARENKSSELHAAHIASVHVSAGPSTPQGKQREERRAEWKTQRRQPAAMDLDWVPEAEPEPDPEPEPEPAPAPPTLRPPSARLAARHPPPAAPTGPPMPLDCEDPMMLQQLQLRNDIHSQLGVIASLFVLRIFLTCLVGYPTPGFRSAPTPPVVQPPRAQDAAPLTPLPLRVPAQPASMDMDWEPEPDPDPEPEPEPEPEPAPAPPTLRPPSARLASRHPPPAAPTGPPMPLDCEDSMMLQQLQVFCMYFANSAFLTPYNQLQRRLGRARQNKHFCLKPAFDDPSNQELLAKLQQLDSTQLTGDHNTITHHSMQLAVAMQQPAWSQQRDQPVRGMMWCPVVAPRKPPQAPRSSQEATQAAAAEPGPSTPLPAKRSKRTKAEPEAAEPSQPTKGQRQGQGQGCQSQASTAARQRIGESRWRPLELCFWTDQGALPAKGKEYPGFGYKRLRDKPPKAQQQQPAGAQ